MHKEEDNEVSAIKGILAQIIIEDTSGTMQKATVQASHVACMAISEE